MQYHSTRNKKWITDGPGAIIQGLAPDGGLYVPERIPRVAVEELLNLEDPAAVLMGALLPDVEDMEALTAAAYKGKFSSPDRTPTVSVSPFYVTELFHGPTSAFKDVALCMLPQLLAQSRRQKGMTEEILILTATSGDTGKAALEGLRDVPGVKICVFYPEGGVSAIQQAQMVTQEGRNVWVCAVRGNFDDAQTGVKNLFAQGLDRPLSTANSMNIGRLVPQVTYYFQAYRDLLRSGAITMGQKVHFSVPTGNFGDILAGYLAKAMGLPVGRLICASNANRVLTDFLATGCYDRRRPLHKTLSPSMDILVSSNLERLLYFMTRDPELVAALMEQLNREGAYQVPETVKAALDREFFGSFCDDHRTQEVIGRVWQEQGYLCDPHTAAAWAAAEAFRRETGEEGPVVIMSTASAYKFPAAVLESLGQPQPTDDFEAVGQLYRCTGVPVPRNLLGLKEKPVRHRDVIDKDRMAEYVRKIGGSKHEKSDHSGAGHHRQSGPGL